MQDIINEATRQARSKEEEIYMDIIRAHGFNDYGEFKRAGYRIEKEIEQLSQTKTINNIIVYKVKECHRVQFIMKSEIINNS